MCPIRATSRTGSWRKLVWSAGGTAWPARLNITTLCPLRADAATDAPPCMAPASGRFSITIGCPSRWRKPWATGHAATSVEPPGAKGTTRGIGRAGQAVAEAAAVKGSVRPAPATALAATITADRRAMAVRATIATGASTAARRDKPPDISLPVFRVSGHMARAIETPQAGGACQFQAPP
jgi:hypothetical protein